MLTTNRRRRRREKGSENGREGGGEGGGEGEKGGGAGRGGGKCRQLIVGCYSVGVLAIDNQLDLKFKK